MTVQFTECILGNVADFRCNNNNPNNEDDNDDNHNNDQNHNNVFFFNTYFKPKGKTHNR